jgi:Rv2525c-like, glycoside hydrolase-like domain
MAEQGLGADRCSRWPGRRVRGGPTAGARRRVRRGAFAGARRRVRGGAFAAPRRRVRGGALAAVAAAAAIALALLALPGPSASAAVSPPGGGTAAPGAMRTVTYHGYEIDVPASWPVYNLAADPARCVLFNEHAVYLGTPGTAQRCPARAYGRTGAVLVQPAVPSGELPPGTIVLPGDTAALQTGTLPHAVSGLDTAQHTVHVAAPGPGVLVTASYGSDQVQVRTILAGARMTSTAQSGTATGGATAARSGNGQGAASGTSELTGDVTSGLGFDACTAPSVATMTAWLSSPYRVAGTYLGGVNWACSYGNFNPAWVSQVAAEGWQFIPIWVGPQAPCTGITGAVTINPAQAAAQGQAEAASAAAAAQSFGYGTGSPIYFDMEGYNSSDTSCARAVLTFLGGWTQGLHAAGYLSGVYSSAGSGIADLASEYGSQSYPRPDDVWIADWTGDPVLTDPYLPNADWPGHHRLHQYYGGHDETWGGATVNVDSDVINGAVAGLPGAGPAGRPFLASQPSAVTAAAGKTATASLLIHGGTGSPALVRWSAGAPAGLTVTPSSGAVTVAAGGTRTVRLVIRLSGSLAAGRYVAPITATAGGQQLTETFEMVSATPAGSSLPAGYPVVLYAADRASMTVAVAAAHSFALPISDVTGKFATAWADVTGGSDLVLAVGKAAANALNDNGCGWPNPAGDGAGSTPFVYPGEPLRQPPGSGIFEPSDGAGSSATASLTGQLLQYALAGTLPDDGGPPSGPVPPADVCLGSPSVPVP